jgi:CheY-like chemotaxis protein
VASPSQILVVDSDELSARFLQRWLTREGHSVTVVDNAAAALERSRSSPPDLILLDLVVHGAAFGVCRELKAEPATRLIPGHRDLGIRSVRSTEGSRCRR